MLFDLRGRGRRRAVKVIYIALALLMGGGLVLFGIGGNTSGGLFDAFSQNSGDATKQIEDRVKGAEKDVRANPRDARAYAVLAESRYQLAGQSKGYDEATGAFSGKAREQLVKAERAWDRHVQLAGDKPNVNLAGTMLNAFIALDKPEKAVAAQELILDSRPDPGFGDYARLAQFAYLAGQDRKGDLAAKRALEVAPASEKKDLKASLDSVKAQAAQQAVQDATSGGAAAPAPSE